MTETYASRTLKRIPEWVGRQIVFPLVYPPVPFGAEMPGIDIETVQTVRACVMEIVEYKTFHPVRGLLNFEKWYEHPNHVEKQVYRCFFGYICRDCQEVFLVPNTVTNDQELVQAMRHECRTTITERTR